MRRVWKAFVIALCAGGMVVRASAQQSPIPVRTLTAAVATDSGVFMALSHVRPLSDGRVLVNDATRRRIVLVDTTLTHFTTVADTAPGAAGYGSQPGMLVRYFGDTTLYLDIDASAFVVIDPAGKVGRAMAVPLGRQSSSIQLVLAGQGMQGVDPLGRVVFRAIRPAPPSTPPVPQDSGRVSTQLRTDSAVVMRADLETRQMDTAAYLLNPASKWVTVTLGGGGYSSGSAVNPVPVVDEWTLLPDGTIAIVRGQDYHIDWVDPTGKTTSSPKMTFAWRRFTGEERARITDSLRKQAEARAAAPLTFPGAPPITRPHTPPVAFEPDELPDYYPPVRRGQVKSDPEGNVWILPTTSAVADSGLVYDLVNRKGEVFERVALPPGRNLLAIGANGVVYMSYTPRRGFVILERAVVRRTTN